MTARAYDVQELLDAYSEHDRKFEQDREKTLADLWGAIRAAAAFNSTIAVWKIGATPYGEDSQARDLFEYLRDELAKIGNFRCYYDIGMCTQLITVKWDRYDLKLPAQCDTAVNVTK